MPYCYQQSIIVKSLAATSKVEYNKFMMRPAATFEANPEVWACGQLEAGPKKLRLILALVPNFGTTSPIQVGFSAKCTSPSEDFNQIENWKCHMFDFQLLPLDRITY